MCSAAFAIARAGSTPGPGGAQAACLACKAVCVLMGELEAQLDSGRLNPIDFVLSDRARLIFHFYLQVLGRDNLRRQFQDTR
jgi:hypothetical protein